MNTAKIPASWTNISLFFFLIVAFIGTFMRSPYVFELSFEYRNLVHAHSHTAFQGWIYLIIFLLLSKFYLSQEQFDKGKYKLQFQLTIAILLGILISFTLQGYKMYSIIFSTLFQLLNYWFIFRFYKDLKSHDNTIDVKFIKMGMWLGLLSTVMPILIGILVVKKEQGTELYNAFVYTFLHLQYNGWFFFIALGLFYKLLLQKGVAVKQNFANRSFKYLTISVIPAIFLSFLGMSIADKVLPIATLAAAIQILALVYFYKSISSSWSDIVKNENLTFKVLIYSFIFGFGVKIVLQALSAHPNFKELAFMNKFNILAYMHLTFIGVLSFLFLAIMIYLKWFKNKTILNLGIGLLFIGFVVSEALLGINGLGTYTAPIYLYYASLIMVIGVFFLLITPKSKSN